MKKIPVFLIILTFVGLFGLFSLFGQKVKKREKPPFSGQSEVNPCVEFFFSSK